MQAEGSSDRCRKEVKRERRNEDVADLALISIYNDSDAPFHGVQKLIGRQQCRRASHDTTPHLNMAPFDTTTARGCSQKPPLTTQAALGASQACPSYLLQVNILSLFPLLESLPTWPLGCHGGVKTQYLFDSTCKLPHPSNSTCTRMCFFLRNQ